MAEEFDRERYVRLFAEVCPGPIETEQEHERLLDVAEALMDKGEAMSPEERRFAALLVILIETYEQQMENEDDGVAEPPAPFETLNRLLASRDLEPADIEHIFGNIHLTREVLAGRRPISGRQAKELGKFFRVPAALFQTS